MCRAPLRFLQLSFMPLEPYPARYARHLPHAGEALSVVILFPHMRVFALMLWGRRYSRIVAFPIEEGGPRQRSSGTFVYRLLETISPALFHPAFPIQPPPLRGTSFHRKEGVSTRAPSLGRGCRAQRGGVGFLFWAAKPSPLCLPLQGRRCVEKSGILVSQPSPLGKGDRAAVDRVLS